MGLFLRRCLTKAILDLGSANSHLLMRALLFFYDSFAFVTVTWPRARSGLMLIDARKKSLTAHKKALIALGAYCLFVRIATGW